MDYIGQQEMAQAKLAVKNSGSNAAGSIHLSKPFEGMHSFWPEDRPLHVSQVPLTEAEEVSKNNARGDPVGELEALSPARRYLPCHYFDYICGSSTGA